MGTHQAKNGKGPPESLAGTGLVFLRQAWRTKEPDRFGGDLLLLAITHSRQGLFYWGGAELEGVSSPKRKGKNALLEVWDKGGSAP